MKRIINNLAAKLPSRLPRSQEEHQEWASSIIALSELEDSETLRHALASLIMHLSPVTTSCPKAYFVRSLQKAVVNDVAFNVLQQLKQKAIEEQRERQAREAASQVESKA